jgi:hypothetical protein
MKNASLIDVMKFNVSYFTQLVALMYRVSESNQRSITFDEHVIMWLKTDRELRQIRHVVLNKFFAFNVVSSRKEQIFQVFLIKKFSIFLASTSVFVTMLIENFMNLSSIMTTVKDQSLKTNEVRKICENWKLCFYCKQQHSSKSIIDCLNKKSFSTYLRAAKIFLVIFSFDD